MATDQPSISQDAASNAVTQPKDPNATTDEPVPTEEQTNGDNQEDPQASTLGLAADAQTMNALKESTQAAAEIAHKINQAAEVVVEYTLYRNFWFRNPVRRKFWP